ncbi:MAG TPA: Nif3-like dinuclear metal center hexameric protein [Syntrophomonadaceae bacterium]|nr:Nif3-like dinuclear metal center hexameric protein [Syntrophomonadaceae bacterium]HOQ09133.1 Nif3-like dinuclear metal center hexameric protein [Syntrophomonadaceae bacterium]HPU48931.1 Nif3-like dinuclear metal center hexameric protein [Syntrophomonadaceae bacterium]
MKIRVKDIVQILERHYPLNLAEKWDNVGLQVGSMGREVSKVVVALELDHQVLDRAWQENADLIITHHPLIFKALSSIKVDSPVGSLIRKLIMADISLYAAHTNLDNAPRGVNQLLAETIGLTDIEPLILRSAGQRESLYKLVVFVPLTHINEVREAICRAGAGFIGKYSDCTFRAQGIGTFKPGEDTDPFIGQIGQLEEVEEVRLETICPQHRLKGILDAMLEAHPYEEVAYDLYKLENQGTLFSPGRKGKLQQAIPLGQLAEQVRIKLALPALRLVGHPDTPVQKVAVVSGSGASFINEIAGQADVLITGDLKYHEAREAAALGLAVIDAGHQATEELVVKEVCQLLARESAHAGWEVEIVPVYMSPAWTYLGVINGEKKEPAKNM